MKNSIILCCTLFILIASMGNACEPCAKTLNFEESFKEADLIIIGQRINDGPWSEADEDDGGPDWIEVKINQVIQGEALTESIKVNSWDAICDYGIVAEKDKTYVMLLKRRKVSDEEYEFDAVNFGCGVKIYALEGELINFDGKKVSVEEFKKIGTAE